METGNYPYISPTPGRISVIASTLVPSNEVSPLNTVFLPSLWDVETCGDCGFNIIGTPGEAENISKISELCDETYQKCNIHVRNKIGTALTERVNNYKNKPSTACWDLGDEPTDRATIQLWGQMAEQIYGLDKNHMCVVNLMPYHNNEAMPDWKNYDEYINDVQKYLKPAVWMFDYYPVRVAHPEEPLEDKDWEYRNEYYSKLKIFSDLAQKTSRPFWACCRSVGVNFVAQTSGGNFPAPTLGQLRFVTYSALAFGAQGLLYWTYAQRKNLSNEIYFDAPIRKAMIKDPMGMAAEVRNKTATWDMLRTVLAKVSLFSAIFYNCKLQEVRCTLGAPMIGDDPNAIPKGLTKLLLPFRPIEKFESDAEFGFLISHIKNGATNYLVVVNRDIEKEQEINIGFNPKLTVSLVDGPVVTPPDLSGRAATEKIRLAAGDMIIYNWF